MSRSRLVLKGKDISPPKVTVGVNARLITYICFMYALRLEFDGDCVFHTSICLSRKGQICKNM